MHLRPLLGLCLSLLLIAATSLHAAAPTDRPVIPLWPKGAPGSEARKAEPEKIVGSNVSNIHQPTLTVYLPSKETATGCAIIVAPGGGHARLGEVGGPGERLQTQRHDQKWQRGQQEEIDEKEVPVTHDLI